MRKCLQIWKIVCKYEKLSANMRNCLQLWGNYLRISYLAGIANSSIPGFLQDWLELCNVLSAEGYYTVSREQIYLLRNHHWFQYLYVHKYVNIPYFKTPDDGSRREPSRPKRPAASRHKLNQSASRIRLVQSHSKTPLDQSKWRIRLDQSWPGIQLVQSQLWEFGFSGPINFPDSVFQLWPFSFC